MRGKAGKTSKTNISPWVERTGDGNKKCDILKGLLKALRLEIASLRNARFQFGLQQKPKP